MHNALFKQHNNNNLINISNKYNNKQKKPKVIGIIGDFLQNENNIHNSPIVKFMLSKLNILIIL